MAETIVLKFGGASLKSLDHFERVADIILKKKKVYERTLIVVSAMEGMTDQLLGLASKVNCNPPKREQDMLLSVGERVSMGGGEIKPIEHINKLLKEPLPADCKGPYWLMGEIVPMD